MLSYSEKRKFPRTEIITQQRIIQSNREREFIKEVGVTKNISATGICFRSNQDYEVGTRIFVYLDQGVLDDLKINKGQVIKTGNFFLARIIWSRQSIIESDPFFEVGCAFLSRSEGDAESINLFTRLVNHFTAEEMADPEFLSSKFNEVDLQKNRQKLEAK